MEVNSGRQKETSTEAASASEESDLRLRELIAVLFAHKWIILAAVALVTAAMVFWTMRQRKQYEAVCTLQYDPNPPSPLRGDVNEIVDPVGSFWMAKEFYQTQNDILHSRSTAERVVTKLGLANDADFMSVPQEARREWRGGDPLSAARRVLGRLRIEMEDDSRIVHIRFRDYDPERAALIANTVVDVYIERTLEERQGTTFSALEWLSTQLDELQTDLEGSEQALHRFKLDNNILSVSMQDRQNIVASDMQQLSAALTEARMRRIELQARLAQLRQANADDPMQVHATLISQNERVVALRDQYATKAADLAAAQTRYGENHPQMRALESQLDTLRTQIRNEIDGIIASVGRDVGEMRSVEIGLRAAVDDAHRQGLELNRLEIEYERLARQRENNLKLVNLLLERTTETGLTKLLRVNHANILDRATAPLAPVSPNVPLNLLLGVLGGLLLGFMAAMGRARMDRTIRSVDDVESLGVPVLGILPSIGLGTATGPMTKRRRRRAVVAAGEIDARDLTVHTQPMSAVAECCRAIRTNLTFTSATRPARVILVTSPAPREGKTTVGTSLAIAMAQSGNRVLLVDTDLRRPRVHRTFGLTLEKGITSVMIGETPLLNAVSETVVPGLSVLPCGPIPPNPSELLHTAAFRNILADSATHFDRVILDSSPLGAVTDAAIIGPQVDGVVLVVKSNQTSRDAVVSSLRQLKDVAAPLLGAVVNDVDLNARQYGYGSRYSYHYYYRKGEYYGEAPADPRDDRAAAE